MEKKTEKAIRILLYTIVTSMVLSIAASLMFPLFVGAIFAKFGEAVTGEKTKLEKRINFENERKRKEIELQQLEKIKKSNEIILAKPKEFKGTIYSWRNEKGERIFSNTGFPKDGKYTDGKVEMN